MRLILVRGISGSGKTTYAKRLIAADSTLCHFEADMYFINNSGEYVFDPNKLKDAHAWCFNETKKCLENNKSVIVSNTFTQKWEINPYINLGKKYEATVVIKKAIGTYANVHNVPIEVLNRMKSRWEDVETEQII